MLALIAVVAILALIWFGRHRIHFNWGVFAEQLRLADWRLIALAMSCIYLGYVVRGLRWVLLMRHRQKLPPLSLVGTQVIGFTAVALIGRVADLVRPYLVAKKTGLPLSSQIAVYIVERLFDFGSMALITCSVILVSPAGSFPHPEVLRKAGVWGLAATLAGALFLVAIRLAGGVIGSLFGRAFGIFSKSAGRAVESRIHAFHSGLDTIRSGADFVIAASLSLGMWLLITLAYLETTRAFVASPELVSMTPAKSVLLMVVSGAASTIQLPVLGWFTQIGAVEQTIQRFFSVTPEASLGCAATLLVVTFLAIVPVGLLWARFDHVSLVQVTAESEHAGEEMAHHLGEEPASQGRDS
ncbi:MAG TPA: lysylphosphatidylglycerol synthase transmembrane domain-containing protein [Acidobacteriaceae bacterium]|nr:lysylphosphatidylglycerol synthase transmembrane domain-containing protein [Acidobacteriaceae bacterium]